MYEYVPDFKSDAWAAFKRGLATNTIGDNSSQTSRAKTILLGGRKDGHICVFDWENGRVIFSIDVRKKQLFVKLLHDMHCINFLLTQPVKVQMSFADHIFLSVCICLKTFISRTKLANYFKHAWLS